MPLAEGDPMTSVLHGLSRGEEPDRDTPVVREPRHLISAIDKFTHDIGDQSRMPNDTEARAGLRCAEPRKVDREAASRRQQRGNDSAPEKRMCWVAMQKHQRRAAATKVNPQGRALNLNVLIG